MEGPVFPLIIRRERAYGFDDRHKVSDFIKTSSGNFIVTGNPGSGKTYFLKQYASYMAEQILEWSNGNSMKGMPKIPVFIDLRDYKEKGSLIHLISDQFSDEVPLANLLNTNKMCLMFDGFNEIEQYNQKQCKSEIMSYSYQNDVVIATRYSGILDNYIREYSLISIEIDFILSYIQQMNIEIPEEILDSFINIFKNPLLFYLFASKKIVIDSDITINKIFESYFRNITQQCYTDFGVRLDFKEIFGEISYNKFHKGKDIFGLEEIEVIFSEKLFNVDADLRKDIINGLIDKYRLLVPSAYNTVSFFHQQISEYFAAYYFSILYKKNPLILNEIILNMRYDFIIGLSFSFFENKVGETYFSRILQQDLLLAVSCVKYMGTNIKDKAITKILEKIISDMDKYEFDILIEIEEMFKQIPFDRKHESLLRELKNCKDLIGGAAASGLLRAYKGSYQVKNELMNEIFQKEVIGDYNYIVALGRSLSEYITFDELQSLIERTDDLEIDGKEECFSSCISQMALGLNLNDVISIFNKKDTLNNIQMNILGELLQDSDENESFELCVQLLEAGWQQIVFPLYMQVKFRKENIDLKNCQLDLERLLQFINEGNRWAIELTYQFYQKSIPFAKSVRSKLKYTDGVVKLVFYYCIGKNRRNSFFSMYSSLLYCNKLPNDIIDAFSEEDWTEFADDIICLLATKDRLKDLVSFINNLDEYSRTKHYRMSTEAILAILNLVYDLSDIEDLQWELFNIGQAMGKLVYEYDLIKLYRIINSKLKNFFHFYVLNSISTISLSDFSDNDINQMLTELETYNLDYCDEILLVNIATEQFIHKRIMPLLESNNEILIANVKKILYKLSEINQIRYIDL